MSSFEEIDRLTHGLLNDEDMSKLAEIKNEMTAALCTSDEEFLKVAKSAIESDSAWADETLSKVAFHLDNYLMACDEMEKEAADGPQVDARGVIDKSRAELFSGRKVSGGGKPPFKITPKNILTSLAGLALLAIPATRAVSTIKRNAEISGSWDDIQKDPEVKQSPYTAENWTVLKDFAPDIAANTVAAKSFIKSMNEFGTVSPKMIGDLINMQQGKEKSKAGFGGPLDPIKDLSTVGGMLGGGA